MHQQGSAQTDLLDGYAEAGGSGEVAVGCQEGEVVGSGGGDVEGVVGSHGAVVLPGQSGEKPVGTLSTGQPVRSSTAISARFSSRCPLSTARRIAIVVLVLALAAACGPVEDPSPAPATTESVLPSTAPDSAPVADPSPPPTSVEPNPPSARSGSGRVTDRPLPTTTTGSILPRTAPDSAPVDDPSSPTTTDSTEAPLAPTGDSADGPDPLPADARSLIDSWSSAVSATTGVWPGFDLASIPTVLAAIDDEGAIRATVAFNHPNPPALGAPIRSLDIDGHKITVIGEVADPDWLAARAPFDFFADVGGTDTFVLIAQEGELGRESGTPEFIALFAHEAFHRYQWDEWRPRTARQYVDRYDFSAANLELVLLENRILIAAYRADNPGDLERLARQFAAVRVTRRQRDFRVAHDEAQERTEGSARLVEHLIGEAIGHAYYMSTDHTGELEQYDQNLAAPELQHYGVKMFFSFLRFYSSGATLLVLLERLGASDVAQQLQDGRTPAGRLERQLAPLGGLDELVADARADHDPDNRLTTAAATLAELALDEPAPGFPEGTTAELACLEANGIDVSGTRIGIPGGVMRKCFGEAGDADDSPG